MVLEGTSIRNVVQFKKATAPGIVTIDETGLKPVTIDSGVINEDYNIISNYKVSISEQYIPVKLKRNMEAGESKIYLSEGTYCLEAITEQQDYSDIGPLYYLKTNDIKIGDKNSSIRFENKLNNLSKLNTGMKETPGFEFNSSRILIFYNNFTYPNQIFFNESIKSLDVYMTPAMIKYTSEVVLENERDSFNNEFEGEKYIRKGTAELFFGGNLSMDLKTDKEQYLTGEKVNFNYTERDRFGNKLLSSSHINTSYGPLSLIEILDNNNNVLFSKEYYTMSATSFILGQNLPEGSYVFRYTNNNPQKVYADAKINISTAITDNAVKLKIGLPENRNLQSATINATNLSTGVTNTFNADSFVDNNCYLPLANGDYKIQVEAYDENDTKVIYYKEIKSPGFYDISPESLQKVELAVRDENGDINGKYANFMLAQSGVDKPTSCYIDSYDYTAHSELYIQKGLYNIEAIVYSDDGFIVEGVLLKHDVSIGSGDDKENIDFNFNDVTELTLGTNLERNSFNSILRDKKSGLACEIDYYGQKTIKISKGSYKIDMLYTKRNLDSYCYILTTDKDFTEKNAALNIGTDFTASLKLDKDTYYNNDIIKIESRICDQYNNQLIGLGFRKWILLASQQSENENYVMGLQDIYDPFMYITDAEGNVVFSQKSNTFYTNGELELHANKIKPGNYTVELSIDVAPAGSIFAKSGFNVIKK